MRGRGREGETGQVENRVSNKMLMAVVAQSDIKKHVLRAARPECRNPRAVPGVPQLELLVVRTMDGR